MKKITIKDISKKVGVSPAVVSVVLNKKDNRKIFISEEKRKKILEIVKKEKYLPNKFAKALATGKTQMIGIMIDYLDSYTSILLEKLQKYALKKGYEIIPYIFEGKLEKEKEIFERTFHGIFDGIIITSFFSQPEKYLKYAEIYNLNILTITPPVGNLPCVYFDEEEAGKIAAEHLIRTGCRKLCVAGGYKNSDRFKGFKDFANKKGIEVIEIVDDKVRGYFKDGFEIAEKILKLKNLPDGIFAFNDVIAGIVIAELNKKKVRIPEEVSIIGCDNTQLCYYTSPNLTSIDIKIENRAKIAIDIMIDLIENKEIKETQIMLKPKLVIRESTRKIWKKD